MITTWLTRTFDRTVPVAAATMAGVADGRFAAAGTEAGILGGLGIGPSATGDWVREQLAIADRAAGPYCVGLMAWALERDATPYEIVLESRPAAVCVSFGDISPWVAALREVGTVVLSQVGTTEQARAAQAAGVDAVIARGGEGGGHGYDRVATLPLLQSVLDTVTVPVLAAGGIATARGLAAVLAAGAVGAWVGTALATCAESAWLDDVTTRLGEVGEDQTRYGHVFDTASRAGWPAEIGGRAVANPFYDTWVGRLDEMDGTARDQFRAAPTTRDLDTLSIYIGQGVGMLDGRRRPISEVVSELAAAEELLRRARAQLD